MVSGKVLITSIIGIVAIVVVTLTLISHWLSPTSNGAINNQAPTYTTYISTTTTVYTTTIPQESSHNISNGNFTFTFTLLNGSIQGWHFPVSSYDYYAAKPAISPIIRLNDSGATLYTYDYRSLIIPSFFGNVTTSLTKGHSAGQFVEEVTNLKKQLTTYSSVFLNSSIYPPLILGGGIGDCKDIGVLMASILEAGNINANYGMNISFEYVDAGNLTDPHTVNHLILYITFANGTSEYIDTTNVLPQTSKVSVTGWRYPLICTMNGCETTQTCVGAYCDAVGYSTGGGSYAYCTTSGYVVGEDNLCHQQCGGPDYYCAPGYYCGSNDLCYS